MLSPDQLLALDQQHVWHPYAPINSDQQALLVDSASGSRLRLSSGTELIDGMSSWWSTIHGYNHPVLNQAIFKQTQSMAHVMFGGLTHRPAIELASTLIKLCPSGLDHVFFADSGSVAVEVAIKMALQYWMSSGSEHKTQLLSFRNGYHGDTFAAMSVCDPVNGMHHLFQDVLTQHLFADAPPEGYHVPLTKECKANLRQLFELHHRRLAATIIEPVVQGAGGMRIYNPDFLTYLRALCDEFNVLFIADEIATGFGRTGKLFACEHSPVSPDILCLGKALTGGYLSFAATLCSKKVASGISEGTAKVLMHGPTFMGNPLACAVANASIQLLLESPWQTRVAHINNAIAQTLEPCNLLPWVKDVRSLGAIGVIELHKPVNMKKLTQQCVEHGIWLRPFGKLVYTMPPFNIDDKDLTQLTSAMANIITKGDLF